MRSASIAAAACDLREDILTADFSGSLRSGATALQAALENPASRIRLKIAHSLWAQKGVRFQADFMKRGQDFYHARVAGLNLADPGTPALQSTHRVAHRMQPRAEPHRHFVATKRSRQCLLQRQRKDNA